MKRLAISFSGGRSSAVMLHRCLAKYSDTHDIVVTFANTGCEHEETLRFVDAVDRHWAGGRVVWIEGEFHEHGVGPTAKVVDYKTAARNGEPFRKAIEKHGIFNTAYPNCTGRLKVEPLHSYLRKQVGWQVGSYDTAIGIRADESDRMDRNREAKRLIYPLVEEGWNKKNVNEYMAQFDWDLKLPSDAFGNCVWCWKKSLRKLMTVAKEDPRAFDFPGEMERRYGWKNNGSLEIVNPRVFFRGELSAQHIVAMAHSEDFVPWTDKKMEQMEFFHPLYDTGGGCGDSCEIGANDQ